jgi:hypothetical protein
MDFSTNFDQQHLLESDNSWFILPIRDDGVFGRRLGSTAIRLATTPNRAPATNSSLVMN